VTRSPSAFWALSDVAAALLAAATVTMISVILQAPAALRFPDWTILLLIVAAVCFVFTVQATIHARHADEDQVVARERWINRSRWTYNVAIVAFWTGVGIAMVPVNGSPVRWAAVAFAVCAALLEIAWIAAPSLV